MTEDKNHLFTRMLDRRDIVGFVKEIEKYQCLYDQNSFQYANKMLKRRTWSDIAKKYKSTVHDCKDKWRKIRIAYQRSLKLSKNGNPQSRPYYLADYLHFISPDKKVDDNVPTTNSPASPVSSEDSLKLEIDEYDHLADGNDNMDENHHEVFDETHTKRHEINEIQIDDQYHSRDINWSSSNMNRLREVCPRRSVNGPHLETQKSFIVDETNPRRMFLMSLMPDIEMLNEHEMRTFRREVIALLDNIVATRESVIINLSTNSK